MGVQGLWSLVSPCRRPIQLETLSGKRLAIDASIWLYQFQMAMRDRKTGETLQGAHIMGTFRRIMKLMFHGIKPVFVFDGDAPMLKKRTIEKRRRRKEGAGRDLAKTAQQLLAAQMRSAVAEKELNRRKNSKVQEGKEVDTGDKVGGDAVYLEDLEAPSPVKPARKDALRDEYALPKIDGPLESRAKASDPRIATEEELREFIEDLRPEDLDINSPFFGNLPTEVKYEILGDLRIKTRQVNHRRVQQMREFGTAVDFSRAQIDNLMERNLYTQRLLDVTDELGRAAIAIPTRVAGQRNREYILVKQDVSQGGGWALGVKNIQPISNEPITIDTTTDESVGSHTDTDEFEEVGAAPSPVKSAGLPTPDVEARRLLAMEAVRARYSSTTTAAVADPFLDLPAASSSRSLFTSNPGADDDDAALQQALFESAQTAAGSPELPRLPLASTSALPPPPAFPSNSLPRPVPRPPPPPPVQAEDTDDDMEYVDIPATMKGKGKGKAKEQPPHGQDPMVLSDDEGSDAFEEVALAENGDVAAKDIPASAAPAPARPPPAPSEPASRHRSPSPRPAATSPSPPPQPASRSIFDTILPSDSESEGEDPAGSSPAKPPPQPSPARPPAAFSRLSPSPDPFEAFEAQQEQKKPVQQAAAPIEPVKAKDFALEEDEDFFEPVEIALTVQPSHGATAVAPRITSPSPLPTVPSRSASPAPVHRASSHALRSPSPTPLDLAAELAATSTSTRPPAPANLPPPLPPLEKAQEAIEAEEAAVLPATIAQLPSPRPLSPSPAHAATRSPTPPRQPTRQPAPHLAPRPAPPAVAGEPVVMYEDDLLLQATGAPAQAVALDKPAEPNGNESPEEFFSDWSRSPSPPGRRGSGDALFLPEEEYDSEAEAEQAARAMQEEENAYAEIAAQLRNEKLEKIRAEAEVDRTRLEKQRNTELRNADGVTRAMAGDIKEMLVLFGIPYIDAPQEAEAECASLLSRQLVDGIVTNDSDVFLFGGSRIYRNMFNESKYVECYLLADLEREIGLDRDKLVRLAYLLGSDYTEGLPGVGPVQGMELLDEFPGKDGLKRFKEWWARVQSGKDRHEATTTWKKRFRKGHKNLILDSNWPNPEVAQAYYRPTVQESDELFTWAGVDLDGLRHYLARTLGWDQTKSDSTLLPLIKREQLRKTGAIGGQKNLTDFFDYSAGYQPFSATKKPKFASKRLQNVVQNWKKTQVGDSGKIEEIEEEEEVEVAEPSQPKAKKRKATKPPPAKAPRKKKSTVASRKRAAQAQRDARAAANGGVYSSEEDLYSDKEDGEGEKDQGKGKGKKRAQPKRKASGGSKKRVVAPSTEEEDEG